MKKGILILLFIYIFTYGCNNDIQPYESTLSPENQRILEEFREALKKNQLKADSISNIYNRDYNYTIPIKAYLDVPYYIKRDRWYDIELFFEDVPHYGMCNSDTTRGFIFSLHFPDKIKEVRIYKFINEKYIGYSSCFYDYNIHFK